MTQEEKQLLLKDLCGKLPYGVICTDSRHGDSRITEVDTVSEVVYFDDVDEYVEIKNCKPYLRPMSSMTKEEIIEFNNIPSTKNYTIIKDDLPWDVANYKQIDWLNTHHFDYRGLIERGLAIEVTNENNPYI